MFLTSVCQGSLPPSIPPLSLQKYQGRCWSTELVTVLFGRFRLPDYCKPSNCKGPKHPERLLLLLPYHVMPATLCHQHPLIILVQYCRGVFFCPSWILLPLYCNSCSHHSRRKQRIISAASNLSQPMLLWTAQCSVAAKSNTCTWYSLLGKSEALFLGSLLIYQSIQIVG